MKIEQICLSWDDFETVVPNTFRDLLSNDDFTDVTLVTGDDRLVKAHKIILSNGSSFFRNIFLKHPHSNPLLYLMDVNFEDLQKLLQFVYTGQCEVGQNKLEDFLITAKTLKVNGLDFLDVVRRETLDGIDESSKQVIDDNEDSVGNLNHQELKEDIDLQECVLKESDTIDNYTKHHQAIEVQPNEYYFTGDGLKGDVVSNDDVNEDYADKNESETMVVSEGVVVDSDKILKKTNNVTYQCEICQKKYKYLVSLNTHTIKDHIAVSNKFKCHSDNCDYEGDAKRKLKRHFQRCHLEVKKQPDEQCPDCKQSFTSNTVLQIHIAANHIATKCRVSLCDALLTSRKAERIHIRSIHSRDMGWNRNKEKEFPPPCDMCGKQFTTKSRLQQHRKKHLKMAPPDIRSEEVGIETKEVIASRNGDGWLDAGNCQKLELVLMQVQDLELMQEALIVEPENNILV